MISKKKENKKGESFACEKKLKISDGFLMKIKIDINE